MEFFFFKCQTFCGSSFHSWDVFKKRKKKNKKVCSSPKPHTHTHTHTAAACAISCIQEGVRGGLCSLVAGETLICYFFHTLKSNIFGGVNLGGLGGEGERGSTWHEVLRQQDRHKKIKESQPLLAWPLQVRLQAQLRLVDARLGVLHSCWPGSLQPPTAVVIKLSQMNESWCGSRGWGRRGGGVSTDVQIKCE